MISPREIDLYIENRDCSCRDIQAICVTQYDNNIPLQIRLYEQKNNKKTQIAIPSGYTAYFNVAHPNGDTSYLNCIINDDSSLTVELTNTTLSILGRNGCQVAFVGGDESRFSSEIFYLQIGKTLSDDDAVEGTPEFTYFVDQLAQMAQLVAYMTDVVDEVTDARSSGVKAELYASLDGRLEASEADILNLQSDSLQAKTSISKNTTSIKTIETKLAEANPNGDPRVSITGAAPSVDIPKTAAPGGVDVTAKGVTLTNRISNGNFANGTTGWSLSNGAALTFAAAEKTVTVTVNTTGSSHSIYQYLSATVGHQYHISYEINPFRTHTPQLYFGAAVVAMTKTAEAGTFTRVSRLITPTAAGATMALYINGSAGTAERDIGKQTKLRRVVLVDLTAHGLDGLTTEQLDYMTALYFDGTKSAIAPRLRSVDISGEKSSYQYIEPYTLRSIPGAYDEITGGKLIRRLNEDGVALVDPEIIENVTSGTLISYPSGMIYAEPALADAGVYDGGISVFYTDFPVDTLETVKRVDFETGEQMPLDVSDAVIAVDGKSFTHPDIADGDIVFFTYFYDYGGVYGENTYSYLDSNHVKQDSVTGTFYRRDWEVVDGQYHIVLKEVQ